MPKKSSFFLSTEPSMTKECPICDLPFKDKQKIVAVMLSEYKQIDSEVNFAIQQPTQCVEIIHYHCYDWQDHDVMPIGEIN